MSPVLLPACSSCPGVEWAAPQCAVMSVLSRLWDETICLFSRPKDNEICEDERKVRAMQLPSETAMTCKHCFLFSATATGICGLGEFPAEEEANNKASPRPETRSQRWSHSCFAHWDCRSVMPYGTIFHLAVLDLVWKRLALALTSVRHTGRC